MKQRILTVSMPENLILLLKEAGSPTKIIRSALYAYLGMRGFVRLYSHTGVLVGTWPANNAISPLIGLRRVSKKIAEGKGKYYTAILYYAKWWYF